MGPRPEIPPGVGVSPAPAGESGTALTRGQFLLLGLGFAPLLVAFFIYLWGKPHYQFFPLALLGAGFLAWTRLRPPVPCENTGTSAEPTTRPEGASTINRPVPIGSSLPHPTGEGRGENSANDTSRFELLNGGDFSGKTSERSPSPIGWERAGVRGRAPGQPTVIALLLGVSFLILALAAVVWSPWLAALAALLCGAGLIWWVGGWKLFRCLLPAWIVVLTIIPPPLGWDTRLTHYLRSLAVTCSSRTLDTLGVIHSQSGNILELAGQKLLVEEACSGINSVLFTAAAGLFYTLWRRRSVPCILITAGSTVIFVVMGNVLRITLGAWLRDRHGVDILSGWPHEMVGLALFGIYMLLIFSTDRWLVFLTTPMPEPSGWLLPQLATVASPAPAPLEVVQAPARIAPYWGWAAGGAFAVLGLVQMGRGWLDYQQHKAQLAIPPSALRAGATFTMPEKVGEWQRLSSEVPALHKIETEGVSSQVWHYRRGDTVASVALDYPFRGYHDVTWCYENGGWTISQRDLLGGGASSNSPALLQVQMAKDLIARAWLWVSTVDERGRWMERPVAERGYLERWKISGRNEPTTYRVQVLVTGYQPLPPVGQEAARRLFEEARELLAQQLLGQMGGKP